MKSIARLQELCFQVRLGEARWTDCVDWAIERLRNDEEGDDLDVVMLAAATRLDEAEALVKIIVERYLAPGSLSGDVFAGKCVVSLRRAYERGAESAESLDPKFWRLYYDLGMPGWLAMLARNCEYATDMPVFQKPFEDEFLYISSLWANADSEEEFMSSYDPSISNSHDAPSLKS